jgi:hypothetical protein
MDDVILNKAAAIERCLHRVGEVYAGDDRNLRDDLTRQDSIVLNLQRATTWHGWHPRINGAAVQPGTGAAHPSMGCGVRGGFGDSALLFPLGQGLLDLGL